MKHINLARIDIFSIWDAFSQDVSISVHLFIFSSTQLFNTHSAKLCARNEKSKNKEDRELEEGEVVEWKGEKEEEEEGMEINMKTDQMGTSKSYLFRAFYSNGVCHYHCV